MSARIGKFVLRHIFQALAIAITLIGTLGYAAGKSFSNGWYQTAGVPPSLFPLDAYETVFQGFNVTSPWKWAGILLVWCVVVIALFALYETWQTERGEILRNKRKAFESCRSRKVRMKIALAARNESPRGNLHAKWKALSPRGKWVEDKRRRDQLFLKYSPYLRIIGFFLMVFGLIIAASITMWIVKAVIIKEANAEGVRQYIGIYAAITGKLPSQFRQASMPLEQLQEYVCVGRKELWKYRVFSLRKSPSDSDYAYLLRATEKFIFLLNTEGSDLRHATEEFNFKESLHRPINAIAEKCPP